MTLIAQVERDPKKLRKTPCHVEDCANGATMICDQMVDAPDGGRKVICGRVCCPQHGCYWRGTTHLCREHAQEIDKWA